MNKITTAEKLLNADDEYRATIEALKDKHLDQACYNDNVYAAAIRVRWKYEDKAEDCERLLGVLFLLVVACIPLIKNPSCSPEALIFMIGFCAEFFSCDRLFDRSVVQGGSDRHLCAVDIPHNVHRKVSGGVSQLEVK